MFAPTTDGISDSFDRTQCRPRLAVDSISHRIGCNRGIASQGDAPFPGNEVVLPEQLCLGSKLATRNLNKRYSASQSHANRCEPSHAGRL